MSPLVAHHRWMLVLKIFIFFLGFVFQNFFCKATDGSLFKDMLFISPDTPAQIYTSHARFPSNAIFQEENTTKLCFNIQANKTADCCNNFNCNTTVIRHNSTHYHLNLSETSLQKHDVVLLLNTSYNFSCLPSLLYNSTGFILNLHRCLKPGGKNIRLSKWGLCVETLITQEEQCHGTKETEYIVKIKECTKRVTCKLPGKQAETTVTLNASNTSVNTTEAATIMKDLASKVSLMGNASTAEIKMGNVTGVIAKLPKQNQTSMNFGFTSGGNVNILKENDVVMDFSESVYLSEEASKMAVKNNGSFAGVLLFPDIPRIDQNRSLFNNEMVGVEMGANIFNLSQTINIQFANVNTTGLNATCVSWDGKNDNGTEANWTTEGCLTTEVNGRITCNCSHLTFFAILMSSLPVGKDGSNSAGIINSSDLETLTQITKAGCGMSMFFLGVALFMHFLIRKNKASEAVKILMNLFVALFFLNLCFLVNESIAKLKVSAACVAMAAALHYSMLATFTWFFMQALHLYLNLHQISTDIKYYMCKICSTGWVVPAVVVVGLLASSKYDFIKVSDDNGTSVSMCWIPDSTVHTGVNIGYYSIVFIFTLTVFIVTVVQIKHFSSKKAKTQDNVSTKKRVFSLLGLFCLLGLTWGFAFFSYGPLLLPSYYIFTILNSFQGCFLFIYYYFSSRVIIDNTKQSQSSSGTTENVYTSSPHG
ncbi:adhesion G-protein coupled receptor G2-like [Poecilia reticulata]|uniref:adhesion G-protein coupled receptor G2-like n=1 Tax=Poecilia reticulata TaxID=8081 RepID=UPI0004A292E1|nr:PREDICTED: adhesion G-protein coupled receptor G2-like [Poecilia reticulata]